MLVKSQFRPLWWLRSPHLQSLWPVFANRSSYPGRKARFTLSDGDFLDLVWFDAKGALVLILHGLEGSIDSHYATAVTRDLHQQGFQVLFMHFRGCSGQANRLDRSYHSGETGDLSEVIEHAIKITGKPVYAVVGYSLGGNILLKFLGEKGARSGIERAVAVSVPYVLSDAALRMSKGLSRLYQSYLLQKLRESYIQKYKLRASPLNIDVKQLKDFVSFDDQVTAPLNGFSDSEEYYRLSSSRQFLKHITTQTLLIHAKDDPFMFEDTVPNEVELSNTITLELAAKGGHVGFITGTFKPKRWLEGRIIDFLSAHER